MFEFYEFGHNFLVEKDKKERKINENKIAQRNKAKNV